MHDDHHHGAGAPGLATPALADAPAFDLSLLGAPGAAAAVLTTGQKDEARELGSGAGFRGQNKADGIDCQCAATEAQLEAKRLATLCSRLALAGWVLHRADLSGQGTTFTATRWGRATETMGTLEAVDQFADRVGAIA